MIASMEDFKKESWGILPVLDVPGLFPPAVMFSFLDSDPRSKYRDTLNRMSQAQNEQKMVPTPPMSHELMRQSLISAAWDSVFHDVPGDRVALLYRNTSQNVSSEDNGQAAPPVAPSYAVGIVSTGPAGTKWLVTRATRFEGKPVCWCKPVEVEKGKTTDVTLTLQDMIDLETI